MNVRALALHRSLHAQRRRAAHDLVGSLATIRAARPTAPALTYFICTLPRSGSWLLSEGLRSTMLAGNPREWFNNLEEQQQRARWRMDHTADLDYSTYLELVWRIGTSTNGICGIKVHHYQFEDLPRKLTSVARLKGLSGAALMTGAFPNLRYIWLTRRDKERQAISYRIAASTDTWWDIEDAEPRKRESARTEPEFDPQAIQRMERTLAEHEAKWSAYFAQNGIDPLVVHYEDLAADYRGHIVRVLEWLGVPGAGALQLPPSRMRRQSSPRNEDWLARYRAFKAENDTIAQDLPVTKSPAADGESDRALHAIPSSWRQWIAQEKLANASEDAIVEVLTKNGYARALAESEVAKASQDEYLRAATQRHRFYGKGVSLLNALGQLRKLDSRANVVERRSDLSPDEFRDHYYSANRPVIVGGWASRWRACSTWTPQYLKAAVGDRIVEIMAGRNADPDYERNAASHRKWLRFAEYADMVYGGAVTNDYNLVANNGFFQRPETHALLRDIEPLPPYLKRVAPGSQCFFWFGPAGAVTPLHHDTSNILAAQIVGRKRYLLIPSSDWRYVYNRRGVFSDVDCEAPDLTRYPLFRNATVLDVVLQPGELLFVPVGWWHHVRALDVSITVSFTNFAYPNHFSWEPRP